MWTVRDPKCSRRFRDRERASWSLLWSSVHVHVATSRRPGAPWPVRGDTPGRCTITKKMPAEHPVLLTYTRD